MLPADIYGRPQPVRVGQSTILCNPRHGAVNQQAKALFFYTEPLAPLLCFLPCTDGILLLTPLAFACSCSPFALRKSSLYRTISGFTDESILSQIRERGAAQPSLPCDGEAWSGVMCCIGFPSYVSVSMPCVSTAGGLDPRGENGRASYVALKLS